LDYDWSGENEWKKNYSCAKNNTRNKGGLFLFLSFFRSLSLACPHGAKADARQIRRTRTLASLGHQPWCPPSPLLLFFSPHHKRPNGGLLSERPTVPSLCWVCCTPCALSHAPDIAAPCQPVYLSVCSEGQHPMQTHGNLLTLSHILPILSLSSCLCQLQLSILSSCLQHSIFSANPKGQQNHNATGILCDPTNTISHLEESCSIAIGTSVPVSFTHFSFIFFSCPPCVFGLDCHL